MRDNIRFSVIIPVYNAEKTIRFSLNSLQSQTFENYEAIIIDDGSTDRSAKICQEFVREDKRFIYYKQKNSGVSIARNFGISHARGDYIAFLDSDDFYEPEYLMQFDRLITMFPEADNFWCGFKAVNNTRMNGNSFVNEVDKEISIERRENIMSLHKKTLNAALWNKVYKRDVIADNYIEMLPELSLGEDLLFNFEYLDNTNGKIVILNKTLYGYQCAGGNSLDNRYRKNLKEIYDVIDARMCEYLNKWNVSEDQWREYYNAVFFKQEVILKNTFHPDAKGSFLKKIRKNNKILRSDKFKTTLYRSNCRIHPMFRKGYESGYYEIVWFAMLLANIKKKIIK